MSEKQKTKRSTKSWTPERRKAASERMHKYLKKINKANPRFKDKI